MSNDAHNTVLTEIADIRPGYPFRGAVEEIPGGDAAVVQIKNVDADSGIDWPHVVRTNLAGRRKPDWLRPGDIVFTARGNRNAAAAVGSISVKAVSAPHLFVIRLTANDRALPGFVAWLINQPQAQHYFTQSATGSYITSIRKQVLQELPLRLPGIEKQKLVVQLNEAAQRERQLLEQLIENRKQQLNLVAKGLME